MEFLTLLRIKTRKKMHMTSLQDSAQSGEKLQDDITATLYLMNCTMFLI